MADLTFRTIKQMPNKITPQDTDALLMQDEGGFKQVSIGNLKTSVANDVNMTINQLTTANLTALQTALNFAGMGFSVINNEICMEEE